MPRYDVIVVGAGPAGSSAAYLLSRAGKKVLLLDKEKLPRYKPCGGGIPANYLSALGFDFSAIAEEQVNAVRYLHHLKDPIQIDLGTRLIALTRRDRFDWFLTQQAMKAGTEVIEQTRVTEVALADDKVTVKGEKHTWEGSYLIAADGANSTIANRLEMRPHKQFYTALEIEAPNEFPAIQSNTVVLDFGIVRRGYAWVFPKSDFHSIGIGVAGPANHLKQKLTEFAQFFQVPLQAFKLYGHKIPAWRRPETLHQGRVLLAGDAAGIADPLTAEGIRYAIESGKIAAQVICDAKQPEDLQRYSYLIQEKMGKEFKRAIWLAFLLYTFPALCHRVIFRNHRATHVFAQLLNGELTYQDITRRLRKKFLFF